ncbi:unnamed protein product [Prorocentrum cordatum]|uniref:Apple domain-containing protein n=1 Tax=Prorocentrum cordatum TaxID=2364126 RepID=A0ABN9TR19_9DINO|nr:unnamed protein product [Polarella glacialis]
MVASARSEPHIPAAPSLPTTPPPETTSRASAETRTSLPASRSCCFGPPGPSAHQQWHDDISDSLPGGAPLVSDVEACQALCCRHACRSLDARPEDGAVRCRLASSVAGSLEGGPLVDAVDGSGYQDRGWRSARPKVRTERIRATPGCRGRLRIRRWMAER